MIILILKFTMQSIVYRKRCFDLKGILEKNGNVGKEIKYTQYYYTVVRICVILACNIKVKVKFSRYRPNWPRGWIEV
jgi:hypothetical protein